MAGVSPASAPTKDAAAVRRHAPTQRRSRERLERILAAAAALIAEHGSDALRMSEVADRADVSIGSLYQYFPDKAAIIGTLAQRYNTHGRACIAAELSGAHDPAALRAAFGRLIDTYYAMFLAEPVMRDIWSATQADKGLRQLELEASRSNGAILATALRRLGSDASAEQRTASALLIMHLGEATMRLAISVGRAEGDAIVAVYKRMVLREIAPD